MSGNLRSEFQGELLKALIANCENEEPRSVGEVKNVKFVSDLIFDGSRNVTPRNLELVLGHLRNFARGQLAVPGQHDVKTTIDALEKLELLKAAVMKSATFKYLKRFNSHAALELEASFRAEKRLKAFLQKDQIRTGPRVSHHTVNRILAVFKACKALEIDGNLDEREIPSGLSKAIEKRIFANSRVVQMDARMLTALLFASVGISCGTRRISEIVSKSTGLLAKSDIRATKKRVH